MRRLSFKTIADLLEIKDKRAVKRWCERHKVKHFKDGKSWYVWETDYLKATIDKTGESPIFADRPLKRETYKPTSSHAQEFARKYGRAA